MCVFFQFSQFYLCLHLMDGVCVCSYNDDVIVRKTNMYVVCVKQNTQTNGHNLKMRNVEREKNTKIKHKRILTHILHSLTCNAASFRAKRLFSLFILVL